MIRRSAEEKREIIHLVEYSELPVSKTLEEMDVPRSTFYRWYRDYLEEGEDGLADKRPLPRQFWNRIPETVQQQVVDLALEHPDKSSRQLAWFFTDQEGYFISESSVYRILKAFDLLENPALEIIPVKDKFEKPTRQVNEMWQMDFTQFKIVGWGWYYLSTVLDDYSRYILVWRLTTTMNAQDARTPSRWHWKKQELKRSRFATSCACCPTTVPATFPEISRPFWRLDKCSIFAQRPITP